MKLGSLFDGIGAFPLSAMRQGITPVWASEIDKSAIAVTKKHFPNMVHLGDITKINGAEIEPVDIISAGSPCQNLSVAGNREGLAGSESQLFHEFIRIVREMREATNNEYPRYILWENVPGAYSSNGGQDFRAVLQEILQSQIPTPKSGRWATAGMVRGAGYSLAWRTLDAQYFGVPQRRKRIFLVADFRSSSAPEILFECESDAGDFAESRSARKEVAACAGDGVEVTSRCPKMWCSGGRISNPLLASGAETFGVGTLTLYENHRRDSRITGPLEVAPTICRKYGTGGNNTPLVVRGFEGDIARTLIARQDSSPCVDRGQDLVFALPSFGQYVEGLGTLRASGGDCGGGSESLVLALDCRNHKVSEVSGTLQSKNTGGYSLNYQNPIMATSTVRRLTPIECERLMGFPDNWTAGHSDSARYRMLGNSVAVPCAEYVFDRLRASVCPSADGDRQ